MANTVREAPGSISRIFLRARSTGKAGGYGQPILTGIRLDDVGLILEGAVPAALLALMVQGGFELAERRLVPQGMRGASVP